MLTFFESESPSGSLPFINEYLEQNPKADGKEFEVSEVRKAKSGKGYTLHTDSFICFIWANSKLAKHLIEALEHYAATGEGYVLVAVVDKRAKEKYRLAADQERIANWFLRGNDYSQVPPGSDLSPGENPFLPPAPHTPSGTQLATSPKGRRRSPS